MIFLNTQTLLNKLKSGKIRYCEYNRDKVLYLFIFWLLKNIIWHHQKVILANHRLLVKEVLVRKVLKKIKIEKKEEVEHLRMKKEKDHHHMIV